MTDIWRRTGPYAMTWADFGTLAERLATLVRADAFEPDVLCCVARGGYLTSGYLATALDLSRLHVVRVRRTVGDGIYADKQAATFSVQTDDLRPGDRVLVAEDIVGSGATAELVERELRAAGAAEVRMATLTLNPLSTYRPRYHGTEVDDWVVFPWEASAAAESGERALAIRRPGA